jgi:hypothetical protein
MKKINLLLLLLGLVMITSCQRGCQSLERDFQITERWYSVTVYSGGDTVFHDTFNGIINQKEHSDGVYYIKNGQMVEISGDYVIKSLDSEPESEVVNIIPIR